MNKEQFTPGPWIIKELKTGNPAIIHVDNNPESGKVKDWRLIVSFSLLNDKVAPEYKANANLIAAAPGTYYELKRLVNFLTENKIHVGTDGSLNMDLDDLIGHAKAALNKANPSI